MSTKRAHLDDKALWQSFATDAPAASAPVSDMDFAAWLEGRLPEETAARIEAAVAADPDLRRAALDLADILGKPLPAPPPRMAVRAQALVGFANERPARRSWLASLLPDFGPGFAFQRGALAASAVVVAAIGFMMGGSIGKHYEETSYASYQSTSGTAARPFGRDTTDELNDLFTDAT